MALTATIYNFDIQLSDVDRGVYETLSLRVACHPSETEEYLVTRVLAYCLEYAEGIAFGKGLSEPNEPAMTIRDMSGALASWVEVGSPDAERLHRRARRRRVSLSTRTKTVRRWPASSRGRASTGRSPSRSTPSIGRCL